MSIYVGNLPKDTVDDDLKQLFSSAGEVKSVKIIKDNSTSEPRGFGFVEMFTNAEEQKAISSINGKELKGQVLKVNEARPKGNRNFGRDRY